MGDALAWVAWIACLRKWCASVDKMVGVLAWVVWVVK